jgi:hypothetical protein
LTFSGSFLDNFRLGDKPATIKSGQSFQLRAPMIEDRAEKEGVQEFKTDSP